MKPAGSRAMTGRAHALVEATAASTARKRVDAWTIVSNRKKCKVEEEKVKDSGGRVKRRTEGEGKSSA